MNKDEARKFLASQRAAKKKVLEKMQKASDAFDGWDELGVNLLGPQTELEKRRILKEIEVISNKPE